ncbi:MAG TPA: hypothetical protein DCE23_05000 [Firmicutes bacterium]|nr:hypothetical protein [Bacillota bacterium]
MEVNEIIDELKYYTDKLPREALKQAIQQKEEITPKLIEMLEYTKNNLDVIYNEEDDFFGYIYAIFLLAEFKEQKAFPYLIDLLNKDEEVVEYIIGDDYPEYLPRLLASTYNGDDEALFSIIENKEINEFIRSSALQTFAILYLYGVKKREFIVNYFKKLLDEKDEEDNSYLCAEIFVETGHLRLVELEGIIEKTFKAIDNKEEIQDLRDTFKNETYKINRNIYPFKPFYEYIDDTIGIMEEWQCFRYKEDEEYEQSGDCMECEYIIDKRNKTSNNTKINIGRNDLCYCGSGKKYKKCCINKNNDKDLEKLAMIDRFVSKAEWYLNKGETKKGYDLLRMAWFDVQDICKENGIKSIREYDEKYEGYDCLANWLQDYENILEESNEISYLYERIELYDIAEEIFNLNQASELYWKERFIRGRANTQFRLGEEERAKNTIETYLKQKPDWVWGYIEMSDWYDNKRDEKNYNIEKSKKILIRAEQIENMEDIEVVYERLESIYDRLGDKEKSKKYDEKWTKHIKEDIN